MDFIKQTNCTANPSPLGDGCAKLTHKCFLWSSYCEVLTAQFTWEVGTSPFICSTFLLRRRTHNTCTISKCWNWCWGSDWICPASIKKKSPNNTSGTKQKWKTFALHLTQVHLCVAELNWSGNMNACIYLLKMLWYLFFYPVRLLL